MSQEAIQESYRKGWKDRGAKDEIEIVPRLTEAELTGYRRGVKEVEQFILHLTLCSELANMGIIRGDREYK